MIVQEPVQAAIWHCLNHYAYNDAIFLSERLYAEVKTDETLFLLATAYFRNGQKNHAYYTLQDRTGNSQCRYLFGICAYELEKYAEAEAVLLENCSTNSLDDEDFTKEYGDQASFVLMLLGKIAAKTERKTRAIEAWKKALRLNPFLWSAFENLCDIGDKPNPQTTFQMNNLETMSMCQGSTLNNIESVLITNNPASTETPEVFVNTPPQPLFSNMNCNVNLNMNINTKLMFTPEESPLARPLSMSGFLPLSSVTATRCKPARSRLDGSSSSPLPSFGQLFDSSTDFTSTPDMISPPTLTECNSSHHQSLAKRVRAQVDQFIGRRESIFQNSKPVFSQSTNVPVTKTPTIPLAGQPSQNVRRSSRLFSNNSVKENNKSPNRNSKFATPKSPSRKTKQRITKCNLNKNANFAELNSRNKMEKERSETVTAADAKTEKSAITSAGGESCLQQAVTLQKQSAEGLMCLLRDLGQAYLDLAQFDCVSAIDRLNCLPPNQFNTSWIYCLLGSAYFEQADYESSAKYFGEVHDREPYRLDCMDVYSTVLWHLQKEVALSALAQELIDQDKSSPVTWCVNGNCFSLHKEHDTAIKFFQRAVQVDPGFPYAYTLLGHEYIATEELDKAMSCFRNAIRLDSRHYNAWFGIGTIYSKQERYQLAEMNYSKAFSINSKSSVILCHIGVVQHALKQTEKALATFNAAIANNPKSPLCKFHRGSIYFALGRYVEALKELEEVKEIVPKESVVYYLIGKVHKKLGNTDLALMHFSWATDLDPKGASSQIKEAFDPAMGRNTTELDSPVSPSNDDYQSESNSGQRFGPLNLNGLPDDSEDSF